MTPISSSPSDRDPGRPDGEATTRTVVCYTRCWACTFGQHSGGWHTWADDPADVLHGFVTRQVDVRRQKCGCHCTSEPERVWEPEQFDPDEPENPEQWPCGVCGEFGACAYDDDARPLVHVVGADDEVSA